MYVCRFLFIFNVFDIIFISAILTAGLFNSGKPAQYKCYNSVQARSPIWANEESLARTRERAAKQRGAGERGNPFLSPSLARFREAHFGCPNRRACSQASVIRLYGTCLSIQPCHVPHFECANQDDLFCVFQN